MPRLINPPVDEDDDINLALLRIAFPGFWFSRYIRGRRLRWVAVRKNGAVPGLHSLVTDDLAELCAVLLQDAAGLISCRPGCRVPTCSNQGVAAVARLDLSHNAISENLPAPAAQERLTQGAFGSIRASDSPNAPTTTQNSEPTDPIGAEVQR